MTPGVSATPATPAITGRQRHKMLFWRVAGALSFTLGLAMVLGSPLIAGFMIGLLSALGAQGQPVVIDPERVRQGLLPMTCMALLFAANPLIWGLRLWRRASRWGTPSAAALLAPDAVPALLYLRSFSVERFANTPGLSWEQQLVYVLQRFAPVIAVGRPRERLPQLGAARWYLDGADWQAAVVEQLGRAALVMLCFGRGQGIGWETEQAMRRVPPQRLVLLIPSGGRALAAFAAIASPDIREALQGARDVMPLWGQRLLIWFDKDGRPRLAGAGPSPGAFRRRFGSRLRAQFEADLNQALKPVFEMHGVPWQPIRPSPWRWFLTGLPWVIWYLMGLVVWELYWSTQALLAATPH